MEKIESLVGRLRSFTSMRDTYLAEATRDAQDLITVMNIGQLYDRGENAAGEKIKPDYAPVTVQIKRAKGQPTDRVTLRDTFAWQSSFSVRLLPDGFEITASDWKTDKLKGKYGASILGLQDENVKVLCDRYYKPKLLEELRRAIYGS